MKLCNWCTGLLEALYCISFCIPLIINVKMTLKSPSPSFIHIFI